MIRMMVVGAALCFSCVVSAQAQMGVPVVSDSRIKTLVYNPNDVYSLLTHYGYQSNIEFGTYETIQTVSVGDRVAWQIIPAGRRLFIKAMEQGAHTNMTVVTNRRAYQFDLRASDRDTLHPSEELVYVVRFFYPEDQDQRGASVFSDQIPLEGFNAARPVVSAPAIAQAAPVEPVMRSVSAAPSALDNQQATSLNYRYTLSGPDAIAPVRIYDDGRATYLTFPSAMADPVQVFVPMSDGSLQPVPASRNVRGELVLNAVQPRLLIQVQGQRVMIYNEAMPSV